MKASPHLKLSAYLNRLAQPVIMKSNNRIIICAKDIQVITGKGERTARRIISKIRTTYNKPVNGLVTLNEFCTYSGLKREDVLTVIN